MFVLAEIFLVEIKIEIRKTAFLKISIPSLLCGTEMTSRNGDDTIGKDKIIS